MIQQFLAGRFSREFIKTSFWKTDKLKGQILLKHSPICSQLSFESAAIIGEYFSDKKDIFVDLLGKPGKIQRSGILHYLTLLWDEKLRKFGRVPKDFSDLMMESEQARILTSFGYSTEAIIENDLIDDIYMAEGNKEIPVLPFLKYLADVVILEGLAGGLQDPALIRKLWHNSYEVAPDDADLPFAVKYGVLSEREMKAAMQPKPLQERQLVMSSIVREFVSKHFPDHIGELFNRPLFRRR